MSECGHVHAMPENDLFPHIMDGDRCACHPTPVLIEGWNGIVGTLFIHNSWDRREVYERLRLLWQTYEGFGIHA